MSPIDKFVNPNFHRGAFQGRAPFQLRPEKKIQSSVRCYAVPNTTGKKKNVEKIITTGKKRYSRLSGGCVIVITLVGAQSILQPEKKVLVVCLADARSLLRPEKKKL